MRPLEQQEKSKILSTLDTLTARKQVHAICVYGSQVAGYAREDSDYDVIVALSPFRQRIKYYYLKGEVDCSALVVEAKSFENDCLGSSLGEFVAGRLLNPYEDLVGKEFLKRNEVAFKRRVVIEGLADAYADYQDFASEIIFKLSYFLFEKLKKRASIYPPVVYSYSQTYGENLISDNLRNSLEGFRSATELLCSEGIVSYDPPDDSVRLASASQTKHFRGGISAKLSVAAAYTTKSIRQYAVHGYAGRVSPTVVGKEVMSKFSRTRSHIKLPEAIRSPRNGGRWSLPEGRLFAESGNDWIGDLMEYFGLDSGDSKVIQKPMGEIYTASSFYTLQDSRYRHEIAVKRFRDIKAVKWGILNIWALKNADFAVNSMMRLYREYHAIKEFRRFGLNTPEVIAVFLLQEMLVTRFIKGKDLSKLQTEYLNEELDDTVPFRNFGSILATVHNNDYCIGDSKPSNALLSDSDSKIYLVDLEQSHPNGNPSWDIAEFIYYSVRFTMKEERARQLVSAFISGYVDKSEDSSVVEKACALRYRAPFQAFIAPNVLGAVLKDLKANSRK